MANQPKVTSRSLHDFSLHLAVKNPQGATRQEIAAHVQHHQPGQPDADPIKEASALYVQSHFSRIDANNDHKVTAGEVDVTARRLNIQA